MAGRATTTGSRTVVARAGRIADDRKLESRIFSACALLFFLALTFAAVVFAHDWHRHEAWKRWFIPLCFAAMLVISLGVTALLTPLVFSSEAWRVFLQGFA